MTAAPWRSRIVGHAEVVPSDLVPNPENWRSHPQDQRDALGGALEEVGWVTEVIVNQSTGHLVDGHLRLDLALSRGEPFVPVTYVDLTMEEERLVLATLDPLAAMADAEVIPLEQLLAQLDPHNAALRDMLTNLGDQYDHTRPGLTDPDDAPDLGEGSNIQRGDVFALGDHRLMCGDAREDMAALMGDVRADCLWTDPPYGVNYVGKTADKLRIDGDGFMADETVEAVFTAARTVVVEGAPFYCASPAGSRGFTFWRAIVAAGWQFHQELVWVKDSMVLGYSDYHFQHEPILYGYAPTTGRAGRGRHKGSRWNGDNSQKSVFTVERPKRSEEHPTMKPVALIEPMLRNSSPIGGVVLEPFAGSGSTIIASQQIGRRCYSMDIDPRYVAVAIERWENFTGQKAEKVDG